MPELRRMRPLLGTFVEVAVDDVGADGNAAVDTSFRIMERVQSLMSFHDPDSELSRLNREARQGPVAVHRWTWRVLRTCKRLYEESDGLFDPSVAERLVRAGKLPAPSSGSSVPDKAASFSDVRLTEGRHVEFLRPLWLDLGGIAKGFAVDVGIATLRAMGIRQAHINAGGDLRAIGPKPIPIHLRDPAAPTRTVAAGMLRNAACATSGGYFTDDAASGIVLPATRQFHPIENGSVTVLARSCMLADALTKIVALAGLSASEPILARFGATGMTGIPR